jgi:hypothetical protein
MLNRHESKTFISSFTGWLLCCVELFNFMIFNLVWQWFFIFIFYRQLQHIFRVAYYGYN